MLASCVALACYAPQLSAQAAYKLGAACSLMLGPGCTVLKANMPAAQLPPSVVQLSRCATVCWVQVPALAAVMDGILRPERQPQAAAAFASSAAKPAALLPWLAALCRALLLVGTEAGRGEWAEHLACLEHHVMQCTDSWSLVLHAAAGLCAHMGPTSHCCAEHWAILIHDCLRLLSVLLTEDTWTKHCDAMAADPALQQAIASVLMSTCLPTIAEKLQAEAAGQGIGWQMLVRLSCLLRHSSLRPAVARRGLQPGAAAAVGHVAAILSLLPASRSGSIPGEVFSALVISGTVLLGLCLRSMISQGQAALEGGSAAASEAELAAAAWQAVQLVPRLAARFAAELDDPQAPAASPGGAPAYLESLSVACSYLAQPLGVVYSLQPTYCSQTQLAAWLAAATASLRLLPRLSALDERLKRHSGELIGVELCCGHVIEHLVNQLPWQLERVAGRFQLLSEKTAEQLAEEAVAWGSLAAPLWALHTSLCRLIAALTAPSAPLSLPGVALDARAWHQLLFCLNASLIAAADAHRLAERSQAATRAQFLAEAPR